MHQPPTCSEAGLGLVHHWPWAKSPQPQRAFAACAIRPSDAARCARFRSVAATCTERLPQGELQPCFPCHLFPSSISNTARGRTTDRCGQTVRQKTNKLNTAAETELDLTICGVVYSCQHLRDCCISFMLRHAIT